VPQVPPETTRLLNPVLCLLWRDRHHAVMVERGNRRTPDKPALSCAFRENPMSVVCGMGTALENPSAARTRPLRRVWLSVAPHRVNEPSGAPSDDEGRPCEVMP
jgi:hypothetical protein